MSTSKVRPQRGRRLSAATLLGGTLLLCAALHPAPARAHFILSEPACYSDQDLIGVPEKSAPCGQADPGKAPVMTNMVTTYHEGQTISLTIKEVVPHPGHYRVAIADTMDHLPADPPVTAADTACGSTTVEATAALPVLGDGLLDHAKAFNGPQTMTVKLPPGLTCTKCTLQVIEFMSSHGLNDPGGCFYHHCATVTILPAVDSGTADVPDAAVSPTPAPGGCSYVLTASRAASAAPISGLVTLAILLSRRRRRG